MSLYSREDFEKLRKDSARKMSEDSELADLARKTFLRADSYHWVHQTNWMGEPILQLPQDMFAIQELIFRTQPHFIIELGTAWCGSLLFYATLLEVINRGRVIGVDTYMPDDLSLRIRGKGKISDRIDLLNRSSTDEATLFEISKMIGRSRDVMVILDSNHTHNQVLAELNLYSPLIGMGHYLVCGSTILEQLPPSTHRPRPWGPGNNPATAIQAFMASNHRFEIDQEIHQKLLLTCNPGGYMRCRYD